MKTEEAKGWGMRVGGPRPYLAYVFDKEQSEIQKVCVASYHRPVKVVMIPLKEYRELKRRND